MRAILSVGIMCHLSLDITLKTMTTILAHAVTSSVRVHAIFHIVITTGNVPFIAVHTVTMASI
jgi:hypothetical protein